MPDSSDDYAKRAYDIMNLHLLGKGENAWGKWVALRLSDGGSNNILYPTKQAAENHQLHPSLCLYLVIPPTGFTLPELRRLLDITRGFVDKGHRSPQTADYRKEGFRL